MPDKGVWLNPNVRVAYIVKGWGFVWLGVGGPGMERMCGGAIGFMAASLGLPWGNGKVVGRFVELGGGVCQGRSLD